MSDKIQRLNEGLSEAGIDAVALVPGPNLFYLTGLNFHLMERPIIAFIPATGRPAFLVPALEASKVEAAAKDTGGLDWQRFVYTDEEGPDVACAQACAALGLSGRRLAVEQLTMRVLELQMIQRDAPDVQIVPAEPLLSVLRMNKSDQELARMRQAVHIAQDALRLTLDKVRPGMTEQEVGAQLMLHLLQGGSEGLPFAPLVQSGPNSASPHGATSDRMLKPGDLLLIDFGATVGGYISDITRTFALGDVDPELVQVHKIVQAANGVARATAKPGIACQEVDRAARQVIEEAGYGPYFIHRTGHGLGLETHEPPYMVEGNPLLLEEAMTFTIEPGIYLPGRGGVRVEDDVVITADGCESLTQFERNLQDLTVD